MRPTKPFPAGTAKRLQELLKQARSIADQRRIQAVLMRALDASSPERIAAITGLSVNTVRVLHSRFLREGEAVLVDRPGRGGRRHSLLNPDQQDALLKKHVQAAGQGQLVEAGSFKREYETLVGHPVAATTVYRLLAKQGWRKIVPRPSHPGKQPEAEAAFKKSTRTSSHRKKRYRARG
jgi:transposase